MPRPQSPPGMHLSCRLLQFGRMSLSELRRLSYEELLERSVALEAQVAELRGQVPDIHSPKLKLKRRLLDFTRFTKRRVALKVLYLGWDYCGLARQESNKLTIAEKLIEAFSKSQMIENNSDIGFAVCGRTDKGVSGLSQVVVLTLRSNVHDGVGVIVPEDTGNLYPEKPEIDYVSIGNKNLPPDIRILAWCPVPSDFSPRRDCISRSYKYFFPIADLDIENMRVAASKLIGLHDFRNFCSSQVTSGVLNHERIIFDIDLSEDGYGPKTQVLTNALIRLYYTMSTNNSFLSFYAIVPFICRNGRRFCCLSIRGSAFLYHQIRCIASILIAIGRGLESPNVIDALLDVQKMPGKPPYQMAEAEPLLFFEPEFQKMDWQTSPVAQEEIIRSMQKLWTKHAIRAQITGVMLEAVEKMFPDCIQNNYLAVISREVLSSTGSKRKPILDRPPDDALEEKIRKLEAGRQDTKIHHVTDC